MTDPALLRRRILLAACFLLAAAMALVPVADPDAWFRLALGRLIAADGLPASNTFSHAFPDFPWQDPEWLFDLLLYGSWQAGGALGVNLLVMLMAGSAFTLSAWTALRRLGRAGWREAAILLPLLLLALAASRFRFHPRPHLASFLGIAVLLALWEARPRRMPLWFFLAGALWANLHAGVVFGLLLACALAAGELLAGRRMGARQGGWAALGFLAGSLCNPGFLWPYRYVLSHLPWAGGAAIPIEEFVPPSPLQLPGFFLWGALALALVPFLLRRREWIFPLLAAGFLLLTLKGARFVPKAVLATFPWVAAGAVEATSRLSRRAFAATAALVLACGAGAAAVESHWRGSFMPFRAGVNRAMTPEGAASFLLDNDLPGPSYNDLAAGGYLAWRLFPRQKVFLDGRLQAYPVPFLVEALHPEEAGWLAGVERWGIQSAVVLREPLPGASPLVAARFREGGWPLVYLDGASLVFVRPGSEAEARTRAKVLRLVDEKTGWEGMAERARQEPETMGRELERVFPALLLASDDFIRFGVAAAEAGDSRMAEGFFRKGLELHPRNQALRFNLGFLLESWGDTAGAREEYRWAARLGRATPIGTEAARRMDQLLP